MKPGHGNAHFIADAHNPRVTLDEMRRKWAGGEYGKMRSEFALGWMALAGRNAKGRD